MFENFIFGMILTVVVIFALTFGIPVWGILVLVLAVIIFFIVLLKIRNS